MGVAGEPAGGWGRRFSLRFGVYSVPSLVLNIPLTLSAVCSSGSVGGGGWGAEFLCGIYQLDVYRVSKENPDLNPYVQDPKQEPHVRSSMFAVSPILSSLLPMLMPSPPHSSTPWEKNMEAGRLRNTCG